MAASEEVTRVINPLYQEHPPSPPRSHYRRRHSISSGDSMSSVSSNSKRPSFFEKAFERLKRKSSTSELKSSIESLIQAEEEFAKTFSPEIASKYFSCAESPEDFVSNYYEHQVTQGSLIDSFEGLITYEVKKSSSTTALRGDTLFTNLWKKHFTPIIEKALQDISESFQSSAQKFSNPTLDTKKAFLQAGPFMTFCDTYLTLIYKIELPPDIGPLLKAAHICLAKTHPDMSDVERASVISGLLFLRLINPYLTFLDSSSYAIRVFTKILQNISNGTTFGGKEQEFAHFNPLVLRFILEHRIFLSKIIEI